MRIDPVKSYQKRYRLRPIGRGISISIPKELVERKARELGITIEELIEKYGVVMMYDNFGNVDAAIIFEKRKKASK